LAKEPHLLLLDEPFGQIDNFKKNGLRRNLFQYLKEKNIACIVATHDKNDALSFADKLIIIKNNQVLENSTPKEIYTNPKEEYSAALFDDVNEITINNKLVLLYPHQLKIIENTAQEITANYQKAIVTNNYFKGSYWLIEVLLNNQKVFLNHATDIALNTEVFIKIQ